MIETDEFFASTKQADDWLSSTKAREVFTRDIIQYV